MTVTASLDQPDPFQLKIVHGGSAYICQRTLRQRSSSVSCGDLEKGAAPLYLFRKSFQSFLRLTRKAFVTDRFSSRCRYFSSVVAPGTDSTARSASTKLRRA